VIKVPEVALACCLWVASASQAAAAGIEPFRYAEPATGIKTFRYLSTASGAQPWVMNATIVETPEDTTTINGHSYRVRSQRSRGIDGYAPTDTRVFYREKAEGVFTGYYDASGVFSEYLQLPADIEIGATWQGPSRYWDLETLSGLVPFESGTLSYQDCLHIHRVRSLEGPPAQMMESASIYCPQIGHVKTRTTHSMDGFQSVTEMELTGVEPTGN